MNRGYFLFSVKLYRKLYNQNLSLSWQIDLRYIVASRVRSIKCVDFRLTISSTGAQGRALLDLKPSHLKRARLL